MDVLTKTLSSETMWGAILASILIIVLGYVLVKVKIFKMEWKKALNAVVLKVALPVLAIKGFMQKITVDDLTREGFILGFSFVFYILLLIIAKYVFIFMKEKKTGEVLTKEERKESSQKMLMQMMWVFGSTTFFGLPIVKAVYGDAAVLHFNLYNIGYRVFLYSYAFSQMAGIKMDRENVKVSLVKIFKNPIIIATFVGLFIWVLQLATPEFSYKGSKKTTFFDLSKTAPWLYTTFSKLAGLCSPLVWLSIGMTLAASNLREAAGDKRAWYYVAAKQLLLPGITLAVLVGFTQISALNLNKAAVATIVVLMATPPATVIIAYAMDFKREEKLAASTSVISTFAAVIAMPFWVVISDVVLTAMGVA